MLPLRASLRVHVAAIAVLLCLTMAFVALMSKDAAPRVFYGVFFVLITGVAVAVYRKETSLAEGHLVGSGTITELKTGARGRRSVKYEFVAFDGKQYQGESDWGTQRVSIGSEIPVLYMPLDPTVNVPLKRFLYYSFHAVAS
jgi:hypothetical protein